MTADTQQEYNIFSALVETIHKKDRGRLKFAKCPKCKRLNPFRLSSIKNISIKCKNCGASIQIRN
ncbi:MAG: hypothetical protein P8X91_01810 [Candidatus Bathyarchaeota archaeon]|jgi:PHP family Zn ribbon phosphoesterase